MILQVIKKGGRFDLRRVYEAFRGCADGIYMLSVSGETGATTRTHGFGDASILSCSMR